MADIEAARRRVRHRARRVREQLAKAEYHTTFQGLPVHIEHDRGDTRSGVSPKGEPWSVQMRHPYGEVLGTVGADGDPVDIFLGPNRLAPMAYVVHAKLPGSAAFDEVKVMAGFNTRAEAEAAFRANYNKPGFLLDVTTWPMPALVAVLRAHPELQRGRLDAAALAQVMRLHKADHIPGGRADDVDPDALDADALADGAKHEREHTDDPRIAREIAADHLVEDPDYYEKLAEMEKGLRARLDKRLAEVRALVKARVKAHQRKLKNGRIIEVGAHERRDEHPHDVLRRAVVRAVVKHGRPMPLHELPAKLPRRHRGVDPKVLEAAVGDLLGFGLLSPHDGGVVPGHTAAPTTPRPAVVASSEGVAFQLMHAWRDYPEARAALERVMLAVGMTRVHAAGDVVPFDGIRHAGDAGWPEDPVVVTHPGWALPTTDGFDRILERAQVRALEKAFQHRASRPKNPTGWEPPGGTHPKTWRRGTSAREAPVAPLTSPAEFKRSMARELVSAWNHVEHPEAREQLERAMVSLGLRRHHTRGERVAFDGRHHVGDGLWAGDAAEVEHPGWSVEDEHGHHRIQKAKVRAPGGEQVRPPGGFAERFGHAFDTLRRQREFNRVELSALRAALPGYTRDEFDRELRKLREADHFELRTSDGRHRQLTPEEQAAAITEGDRRYVYVSRRGDSSGGFAEHFDKAFDRLSRNRTFGVVELWALREELPTYPRAVFDQELGKLRQARRFELWTADGRHHVITPQERDAAIEERGQQYYYVVRSGRD